MAPDHGHGGRWGGRLERLGIWCGSGSVDRMAKLSPFQFVQQVRQEVSKVTWPTRKESTVTTIMVFVMVFMAAIFFFLVDQILAVVVKLILGLGG